MTTQETSRILPHASDLIKSARKDAVAFICDTLSGKPVATPEKGRKENAMYPSYSEILRVAILLASPELNIKKDTSEMNDDGVDVEVMRKKILKHEGIIYDDANNN